MTENFYHAIQAMSAKLYKIHKADLKYENMLLALETLLQEDQFNVKIADWSHVFSLGGALYTSFTTKIMLLPETIIDGYLNHHRIHKNHFMMQIFRIPLNETCSVLSMLKIACYTGILSACLKAEDFPEGIVKAYKALNIHSSTSYVDLQMFNEVLSKISKDLQSNCLKAMVDSCRV